MYYKDFSRKFLDALSHVVREIVGRVNCLFCCQLDISGDIWLVKV